MENTIDNGLSHSRIVQIIVPNHSEVPDMLRNAYRGPFMLVTTGNPYSAYYGPQDPIQETLSEPNPKR